MLCLISGSAVCVCSLYARGKDVEVSAFDEAAIAAIQSAAEVPARLFLAVC
jgi:hypothetical protein